MFSLCPGPRCSSTAKSPWTGSGYDKRRILFGEAVEPHLIAFDSDGGFAERRVERFRFEQVLDADTFVVLTRTYPRPQSEGHDAEIRSLINQQFGGAIAKVEDALLHLFQASEWSPTTGPDTMVKLASHNIETEEHRHLQDPQLLRSCVHLYELPATRRR